LNAGRFEGRPHFPPRLIRNCGGVYPAAKREWRETCDADDAAFLAICAYVPRSPEEGKIKAKYLIATRELMAGFKDEDIEALLQSIAGGPPNV